MIFEIKGKKFQADEEDMSLFFNREWCVHNHGYLTSRHEYFHRLVMKAKKGEVVDHINGDTSDNRKSNLRLCNQGQNVRNRRVMRKGSASKFKGVCWDKKRKKWLSRIGVGSGKLKNLGRFDNEIDAAIAYNNAALKIDPEYYVLNEV